MSAFEWSLNWMTLSDVGYNVVNAGEGNSACAQCPLWLWLLFICVSCVVCRLTLIWKEGKQTHIILNRYNGNMWSGNKLSCLQPCGRVWCDLFGFISLCVFACCCWCVFSYLQWVYIYSIAHSMNAVKVNNSKGTFDLKPLKLKCHVDCYALHVNMCEIASRCLCML